MNNNDFYNILKCSIESLKESSLSPLLRNDKDYQKYLNSERIAEKNYLQLDLSENQKSIVNTLLDARDKENSEYSNLSYLAGIIDCIQFLKYLNVPVEETIK